MKRIDKISLQAVAESCGTSLSTVYRVMQGRSKAGNPVHELVRKRLFETGHFSGRISPVMLVIGDRKRFAHYKHGDLLIDALLQQGAELGINFMMTDRAGFSRDLKRWRPAGVIALDPEQVPEGIPAVNLNHIPVNSGGWAVCRNGQQDYVNILRKLLEGGYRKIGLFYPFADSCETLLDPVAGLTDFPKAFETACADWNKSFVFSRRITTETHFEMCAACARYFASLPEKPEVLLLCGGVYISAVSSEFRRLGCRMRFAVPDEWRYYSEPFDFPADEVAVMGNYPGNAMASAALELLFEQIHSPDSPPRMVLLESKIRLYTPCHETGR